MTQTSVPTTDERPLLIVISTGPHRYREYLFASMHSHYRIHLINTAEPTWERPYLAGFTLVASTEADLVLGAAREIAARGQVHGVMSWDEARILQAALVAQDLGLPGSTPDAVRRCRDKHESRLAMAEAGLPQPRFELAGECEEALAAAERIGYPVVLKPRAAAASYGVVLVHDADQLAAHFAFSRTATVPHAPRFAQSVLVEQYLAEHEVSVDSVVYQGRVRPLFVAHKELGFPPYFEETSHYVDGADPLLDDPELRRLLRDTHAALGYTDGWTHAEFKLTASGPKVIEVNGRL
jgi:biotin carboxylase